MQRVDADREPKRYNVLQHGVLGDGTTDDTSAIHALRTAAGSGSVLVFPPATYLISALTINVTDQTWELAGGATIKLKNAQNATALTISGARSGIRGGVIDVNRVGQSSAGTGVMLTGDDSFCEGAWVKNSYSYGIRAANAARIRIARNRITDSPDPGIFCQAASADMVDLDISHNLVDRTGISAETIAGPGIQVRGGGSGSFSAAGARIIGNVVRMPTSPTSETAEGIECGNNAVGAIVQGNSCFGGSIGISMISGSHMVASGNAMHGQSLYGLESAGCTYSSFTGNTIDGTSLATHGISCSVTSGGFNQFSGNVIRNIAGDAILIQENEHSIVASNVIDHNHASYAININASNSCVVNGNDILGNSVALKAITFLNCVSGIVSANMIKDFTENAVLLYGSSAITIDLFPITGNVFNNTNNQVSSSLSGGATLGSRIRVSDNAGSTRGGKSCNFMNFKDDIIEAWGTGDPSGVVVAGIGSIFHRTDGGAGTCQYVKESATDASGWVAK